MHFPLKINGSILINSLHLKAFMKRFFYSAWAFITAAHLFRSEYNTIKTIMAFFTHVQSNYSWRFFIYCSSLTWNWYHVPQLIISYIEGTGGQGLQKAIKDFQNPFEQKNIPSTKATKTKQWISRSIHISEGNIYCHLFSLSNNT